MLDQVMNVTIYLMCFLLLGDFIQFFSFSCWSYKEILPFLIIFLFLILLIRSLLLVLFSLIFLISSLYFYHYLCLKLKLLWTSKVSFLLELIADKWISNLMHSLQSNDWSYVLETNNVECATSSFLRRMGDLLDKHFPLRKRQRNSTPECPWMSKGLINNTHMKAVQNCMLKVRKIMIFWSINIIKTCLHLQYVQLKSCIFRVELMSVRGTCARFGL